MIYLWVIAVFAAYTCGLWALGRYLAPRLADWFLEPATASKVFGGLGVAVFATIAVNVHLAMMMYLSGTVAPVVASGPGQFGDGLIIILWCVGFWPLFTFVKSLSRSFKARKAVGGSVV